MQQLCTNYEDNSNCRVLVQPIVGRTQPGLLKPTVPSQRARHSSPILPSKLASNPLCYVYPSFDSSRSTSICVGLPPGSLLMRGVSMDRWGATGPRTLWTWSKRLLGQFDTRRPTWSTRPPSRFASHNGVEGISPGHKRNTAAEKGGYRPNGAVRGPQGINCPPSWHTRGSARGP